MGQLRTTNKRQKRALRAAQTSAKPAVDKTPEPAKPTKRAAKS